MFRRLLKALWGGRAEPAEPPPDTPWYELPDDVTVGGGPYDPAKRLRVWMTELDDRGAESTGIVDLQLSKSSTVLTMLFGNGMFTFREMRAECESAEAHREFVEIVCECGGFEPCEPPAAEYAERPLFRSGYEVYHLSGPEGVCAFINPVPNPSVFPEPDTPAEH